MPLKEFHINGGGGHVYDSISVFGLTIPLSLEMCTASFFPQKIYNVYSTPRGWRTDCLTKEDTWATSVFEDPLSGFVVVWANVLSLCEMNCICSLQMVISPKGGR